MPRGLIKVGQDEISRYTLSFASRYGETKGKLRADTPRYTYDTLAISLFIRSLPYRCGLSLMAIRWRHGFFTMSQFIERRTRYALSWVLSTRDADLMEYPENNSCFGWLINRCRENRFESDQNSIILLHSQIKISNKIKNEISCIFF